MIVLLRTPVFDRWLLSLKDDKGKARVLARLRGATMGNFGDSKPVGGGVSERRIDVGPGYRVYFMRRDKTVYVLLAGGDKSTQRRDISRALEMARAIRET